MYLKGGIYMILEKEYLRDRAVLYARKYALVRNPLFYTFEGIGGNCTNFASQCVLAGSCTMNYTSVFGWYYLSINRRSASWTGVDFFYDFMTTNQGVGPFAVETDIANAQIGDLIQLQNFEGDYYHTLVITKIEDGEIYICANSNDALDRPLSSYDYMSLRVIHILGVRYDSRYIIECFESLYSPPLPPVEPPQGMPDEGNVPITPQDATPTPQNDTQAPQEAPSQDATLEENTAE